MRTKLLALIDAGPYHARTLHSLSAGQRKRALDLMNLGWIRRMPRSSRFAARYVVTSSGSHALGTFASFADLTTEIYRMRRKAS